MAKQSNMYPGFKTINPLSGACQHSCKYCFVNDLKRRFPALARKYSGPPRLADNWDDFPTDGEYIFVCSCNDLFAADVPDHCIDSILDKCCEYDDKVFLLQSKNADRLIHRSGVLPKKVIVGTTIETTYDTHYSTGGLYAVSNAPPPWERAAAFDTGIEPFPKMVSIEPVLKMDVLTMVGWIRAIRPFYVSVGADSKGHHLPEPSVDDLLSLVHELSSFTTVRLKLNLRRILGDELDGLGVRLVDCRGE